MLCSSRLGFSQTTGADTHKANAYRFQDFCPHCKTRPSYSNGHPVVTFGETTICTCGTSYRWIERYEYDLSALFVELRNRIGWTEARNTCERMAYEWGKQIGALQEYNPA